MLTQMVPSGVKGRPVPKTVSTQEDRLGLSLQHYLFQLQNLKGKIYLLQKKTKQNKKLLETKISIVALCRLLTTTDVSYYVATPLIYSVF